MSRATAESTIAPGHSGLVALVSDPGAVEIRNAMADAIVSHAVDKVLAQDIKAAAKEVETTGDAGKCRVGPAGQGGHSRRE